VKKLFGRPYLNSKMKKSDTKAKRPNKGKKEADGKRFTSAGSSGSGEAKKGHFFGPKALLGQEKGTRE